MAKTAEQIKVRVLVDCAHGKCNSVVTLDKSEADAAESSGLVCSAPGEVAYAESIAPAPEKAE